MVEDILNSISAGLKNALNEKAGIIEFDNFEYRKEICGIAKQIKLAKIYNVPLVLDDGKTYMFAKFSFKINSISWLDNIDVYYRKDFFSDAGALTGEAAKKQKLFITKDNGNISLGSIYIINDDKEKNINVLHVLFHEMCHLYDFSKFKEIWMRDEIYYIQHQNYDITKYNVNDNINNYSLQDIHNIITESMRFANFTESHAFLENINFEIFEKINNGSVMRYLYIDKETAFMRSSRILYDIYILEKITDKLKYVDNNIKKQYIDTFKEDINFAYYNFNTFDKVINYIYKKLHKIILHSRTLFNYYYNLDSTAKKMYELDESIKDSMCRREHYTGSKRYDYDFID